MERTKGLQDPPRASKTPLIENTMKLLCPHGHVVAVHVEQQTVGVEVHTVGRVGNLNASAKRSCKNMEENTS
jgi:hypothetical protein